MSGESINNLTSDMVLGYFETVKSNFYIKLGVLAWFEGGDVEKHLALSRNASAVAEAFNDELAKKALASLRPEVVKNLMEDAVTSLLLSAWAVFEQVIKDLTVPDYATHPQILQADYHNGALGLSLRERADINFFYYLRNAIVHYNGTFHAFRTVDVTYRGEHYKSDGHFGEKIEVGPKLAMQITDDLQAYAMKAWSHVGRA